VWEYINSFFYPDARSGSSGNATFRAHRYGPDHPALQDRDFDPKLFPNLNRLYKARDGTIGPNRIRVREPPSDSRTCRIFKGGKMIDGKPEQPQSHPHDRERSVYGYDAPAVQQRYIGREAAPVADFFLPHLQPGMRLLDGGCGPGTITLGLAEAVAPGQAVGIDLEPSMVERANILATERQVDNVHFEVANIGELPFPAASFDVVFTCSVLEHLVDPIQALQEIGRVLKPGGLIGVSSTDWSEPLISPPNAAVGQFFELFERGFKHYGGSLNRGRHLRLMLRQAGFHVTEFSASYNNSTTPAAVQNEVEEYVVWMAKLPLFEQVIALGWVDRPALQGIEASMRQWSQHPDAFLATGRCRAMGRKA
jgi:ubiquinone/menaquinone biosynthesis C-methylase UbiE